jgi:hypothetical protein
MGPHPMRYLQITACGLVLLSGCSFDASGLSTGDVGAVDGASEAAVDLGGGDADLSTVDLPATDAPVADAPVTLTDGPQPDQPPPPDKGADSPGPVQTFAPSNLAPTASLPPLCGALKISGTSTKIDTTTCTFSGLSSTTAACTGKLLTQQGSSVKACVVRVASASVASGAKLTVQGKHPLILLSQGDVSIAGTLDAAAAGSQPGPGGASGGLATQNSSNNWPGVPGSGAGGGKLCPCTSADKDDCAGGGGGFGTSGANGGLEAESSGGCSTPSSGGGTYGSAALKPLVGGSGGASGRNPEGSNGSPGDGGGGGGAIQISAQGVINVGGAIDLGGGGGGGSNATKQTWAGGGGGGGSGGAVLLEARQIKGSGWVSANGGGGGGGGTDGVQASDGQGGLPSATPAKGGAKAKQGEDGGGGAAGSTNAKSGDSGYDAPGGGGGGLGRLRLNWCQGCSPKPAAPTIKASGVVDQGTVVLAP